MIYRIVVQHFCILYSIIGYYKIMAIPLAFNSSCTVSTLPIPQTWLHGLVGGKSKCMCASQNPSYPSEDEPIHCLWTRFLGLLNFSLWSVFDPEALKDLHHPILVDTILGPRWDPATCTVYHSPNQPFVFLFPFPRMSLPSPIHL